MMRTRTSARVAQIVGFSVAFIAGLGLSSAWASSVAWDGRDGSHTGVDGTKVYIKGDAYYAPDTGCVIYSLVMNDVEGVNHHIELGIPRCGSHAGPSGTCVSGHFAAEAYDGATDEYRCVGGGDFDNDVDYFADIERTYSSDTSPTGYIGNTSVSQGGFALGQTTIARTWGEMTGDSGTGCPNTAAAGYFRDWKKLLFNGSYIWSTITDAPVSHDAINLPAAPCWYVWSMSGGDYHVS